MATNRQPDARVKVTRDNVSDLVDALKSLTKLEVLVGFPDENADRWSDTGKTVRGNAVLGGADADITNASLAYIHDNGAPEQNIPARRFMVPGIESAQDVIVQQLISTVHAVLRDPKTIVEQRLHRVGITASVAIKRKINEGIAPPLSDMTLRRRAAKGRKGAATELAARALGQPAGTGNAKPLIDTGQMRNAVSYVIRPRGTTTTKG